MYEKSPRKEITYFNKLLYPTLAIENLKEVQLLRPITFPYIFHIVPFNNENALADLITLWVHMDLQM